MLVAYEQIVAENRLTAPSPQPPDLRAPLALAGTVIAVLLFGARRRAPRVGAMLGSLFLILAGVAGLFLLGLWMLTLHRAAWANANLLLFNPLAFLLLRPLRLAVGGTPASRAVRALLALQAAALAFAVLLHVFTGSPQQNQPWLLFSIPVWSVLMGILTWSGVMRTKSGPEGNTRQHVVEHGQGAGAASGCDLAHP